MDRAVTDVLKEARALISDPEHWTQGSAAIENTGAECLPTDPDAYAFCGLGAILHVLGVSEEDDLTRAAHARLCEALWEIEPRLPGYHKHFVDLNDDAFGLFEGGLEDNHAAVLRAFDAAIRSHA